MSSYRQIAEQYKNELDTRISNDKCTVKALLKKPDTLLDLRRKKVDGVDRAISTQYQKELNDRIYNDSITVEALNQLYQIDAPMPLDNNIQGITSIYNAFNKVQKTEEVKDNINKLRLFLKEIEPRDGVITNVVKILKNYEINDILQNQKKYMNLFKKYLGNQNASQINADSYLDIIRDVIPNNIDIGVGDDSIDLNDGTDLNDSIDLTNEEKPRDNTNNQNINDFIILSNPNNVKIGRFINSLNIDTKIKISSDGKKVRNVNKSDMINIISKHFNDNFNNFKMEWDDFDNLKSGVGLKKKKRKIIKGCGLIPQTIPKVKQLGRSFLMLRKLFFDNILSLKYTNNLVAYPNFPNVKVSDELKNIIINCLEKVPPGQDDILNLTKDEKIIYLRVCLLCGLDKIYFDNRKELLRDIKNDFEVGQGEIEAGNNNEDLIYKVKMLAQVLKEANCISHKDLKQLHKELEV